MADREKVFVRLISAGSAINVWRLLRHNLLEIWGQDSGRGGQERIVTGHRVGLRSSS